MGIDDFDRLERLQSFVRDVTNGMGRLERRRALGLYLTALLLPGERKSLEPLALRVAPTHQRYRSIADSCRAFYSWRLGTARCADARTPAKTPQERLLNIAVADQVVLTRGRP